MSNPKRTITIALAILAGALLLVLALRPDPVPVAVAEVRRGPLQVVVEEQGKTRARDRYTVAAPISGRMLRTEVDEGDEVAAGAVLATMVPPPEDPRTEATIRAELAASQARLREAEAALSQSQTQHVQTKREAERREELFRQGAISTETREKYQQSARASKAGLERAQAALRAAKADVDRARSRLLGIHSDGESGAFLGALVRAPVAGTVLRVYEESERVLPAGTPLFEVGKGHGLELVIDLLTEEAVQVKSGDPIRITGWGGRNALEGSVRYVEPQAFTEVSSLGVEEQRVNVIGDLEHAPPSLGAGYRIEASIVTWKGDDVLTVPASAMFQRASGWHVFVANGGTAELRKLEVGRRGKDRSEVLDGLVEGDHVIVFPSDLVADGVSVASTLADGA